jgi:hypothetical protein
MLNEHNSLYSRYFPEIPAFGSGGKIRKIPAPLLSAYDVSVPTVVITDPTNNGSQTACVRWFGEVLGDKEKTARMTGFQYLFPVFINPFDERFFSVDGRQRIEECQVVSIDNQKYEMGDGSHDTIQLLCYECDPLCVVYACLISVAHPWFGLIQPKWYADPARGDSSVQRIRVTPKKD